MKDLLRPRPAVRWLPWSRAPFDRAREENKVILLSIAAAWSGASREMDDRCYGERSVADEINRWFVPVRVDADRRPDIADRYDLGGLPTTAFLNAEGQILGGGTFVPADRLMQAMSRLREPGSALAAAAPDDASDVASSPAASTEALVDLVFGTFDDTHAGFGTAPKFPLAAPVRLALDLFRETGSDEMADRVTRTLDAMGWNGLYDDEGGGFFRCATRADWHEPQPEKVLLTQAALLDLYLEAGVTMGNERWLARAADVLEFAQARLAVAPGEGWRTSEQSDNARLTDANAQMAAAALHASRVFDDDSLRELALQSVEFVVLAGYRPGQGVAHCAGGVTGLLADQVAMARAQLDAWDLTHDVVYQMMAQELAHFAIRTMWDPEHGAFFDRASNLGDDLGRLARPSKPFVLNCEAAELLHRLALSVEDAEFDRLASITLDVIGPRAALHGPLSAHYVIARRSLSR
jgi:uncharacterized protein YyaL (SSP411 family)